MEARYQQYADRGLIIIGGYMSGWNGTLPSPEELDGWATDYGSTFPVMGIDIGYMAQLFGNSIGTPSEVLLAPGMEIVATGVVTDADIEAVLPE